MTVDQLREALASMPGHIPVTLAMRSNAPGSEGEDFFSTLDCSLEAFPTQGRIAVIRLNHDPV